MYDSRNPFKTQAERFPKLANLIGTLDGGRPGDYARNRRTLGYVSHIPSRLSGV